MFSVVNRDSKNRRNLTNLLLSTYPGCIVYEMEKPADVVPCLRDHIMDAVIWELTEHDSQDLEHLNMIKAQQEGTLILICAEDDTFLDDAMWNGASMYFMKPMLPEQIVTALGTNMKT